MLGWEETFEEVVRDLTESRKRLKALKELASSGKVSKVTYDKLYGELNRRLLIAEEQRRNLLANLNEMKIEIEKQCTLLSKLIEYNELRFASGELSEDYYEKVSTAMKYGLDDSNRMLDSLQEATKKLDEMAPVYSQQNLDNITDMVKK